MKTTNTYISIPSALRAAFLSALAIFAIACSAASDPIPTVEESSSATQTTPSEQVAVIQSDADTDSPSASSTEPSVLAGSLDSDTLGLSGSTSDDSDGDVSYADTGVIWDSLEIPPLPSENFPDAVPEDVGIIWESFRFITDEYVDQTKVNSDAMSEAAIRAFIAAIGDPHMSYIPPERYEIERADLAGAFEGIGASVNSAPDGKGVVIVAPQPGSPAEEAGIRPGDRILAVDGVDATTWSVTEAVLKIRGERGTPVVLTVIHVGDVQPVDITIIRDRIQTPSVNSRMIPETPYGELNLNLFTDETPREIREHMSELIANGAEGVVIDLRNNPGGLLQATLDVSSEFISQGRLAYELDRDGNRRDFYSHGNGNFTNIPIVLIVNQYSGSGAELFAGAIQDHGRALLIGVTTFGKGSVNITRRLSNGGGLNITIRRWYTPNGNIIEGVGLQPDVEVEYPENITQRDTDFTDPQLEAAITQLDHQTRITTSTTQ